MKKKIRVGDLYEDCAYHPVKCTFAKGDDVEGISLVNGSSPRCCSLSHCNPTKISKKEAEALVELWKKGEKAVLMHRGWKDKDADEFIKNWRT